MVKENITKKGHPVSEATRLKLSRARMGKNNPMYGVSLCGEKNGMFGKTHTPEVKKKMSLRMSGSGNPKFGKGRLIVGKDNPNYGNGVKISGTNNPMWKGGLSFENYTLDWKNTLRDSIRQRDGYECQVCGKPQQVRKFDVHHIDYDKKNCNPDNLITLCKPCHTRTNAKRDYWVSFFKNHEK
jgi:hypothetical protein